jgi:hypothetical protein
MYRVTNGEKSPNLTRDARGYVLRLGASDSDLFHHVVTVLTAGADLTLPPKLDQLRASAVLGYRIASLFTSEPRLADNDARTIAVAMRVGKEARMLRGNVLAIDDGWHVERRDYSGPELVALSEQARAHSLSTHELIALLGTRTCDVYLNDRAFWRNVPENVWTWSHEGVPLLESWLRDRMASAIRRPLTRQELAHFSHAARNIAMLLALEPALAIHAARALLPPQRQGVARSAG